MGPEVILGAKEADGKLPNLMLFFLDVERDISRMADLTWPPAIAAQFDPYNVAIEGFAATLTAGTEPGLVWGIHL